MLCSLLAVVSRAQPGSYIRYSAKEGLSGNHFYDVVQDRQGFIWISSNTGVYRFDGTHFRQFRTKDGLPDNEVLSLHVDRYDRLWFCCFNGKLGYYQNGRFFYPGNTPELAGLRIKNTSLALYEGRNDCIYFLGSEGYCVRLKMGPDGIRSVDKKVHERSTSHWEDGTYDYHYYDNIIYKNHVPVFKLRKPFGVRMAAIYEDAFYYVLSEGLFRFRDDTEQLIFPWNGEKEAWSLEIPAPGHLFISCNKGKVVEIQERSDGTVSSRLYTDVDLPGRAWSDRDGGVWIGSMADGLYYYPAWKRHTRSAVYSPQWPGRIITELHMCGEQLIAGFENGSVACFNKELELDTVLLRLDMPSQMVKNIHYVSGLGRMIVTGGYIFVWEADGRGHFRSIQVSSHPRSINTFMKDSETGAGWLYANSIHDLFKVDLTSGRLQADSFFGDNTRKFAICPDIVTGRIWYSDLDGLHLLDSRKGTLLHTDYPFQAQRITDIKIPKPGMLLFTTESEGLAVADTLGNIRQRITPQAWNSGAIDETRLYGDELWLSGESGVGMFRRRGTGYNPVLWMNKNNGLLSDNVLAFCRDEHFLYVATAEGLQRLDIRSLARKPDKPRLFIHTIQSKGQTWINPGKILALPEKSSEIKLECSALSFGSIAPVTFAYRFEGSNDFIETSGPFFSIPVSFEGSKKLHLRCRKGDSEWSEETVLSLRVPVPFFRRWSVIVVLFIVLLALAILTSSYFARRLRRRQLRERDLKLQVASLEMRALQAMMNPHFVFNALNSIQNYINGRDGYQANKYLAKFSKLIRSSLNSSRDALNILAKELEYISHYLDLEQLRFEERLHYTVDVGPGIDTDQLLVPGMLLQPLVENAVIHGVMRSRRPVHVSISCTTDGQHLFIAVRDDGPGLSADGASAKEHKSMGLGMIRNRLQLLNEMHGKEYSLTLTNNSDRQGTSGATAMLKLPLVATP